MNLLMVSLIIILIIILCIFLVINSILRRMRRLRGSLIGELLSLFAGNTSAGGRREMQSMMEGIFEDQSNVPKSVSGMTSIYLPKITADFPDFNYEEMRRMAITFLTSYLRAMDIQNADIVEYGDSELKRKLANRIDMNKEVRIHEHYEQIRVHQAEISDYRKMPGKCRITFQSSVEYYYYKTKAEEVISGSKQIKHQAKYDVQMLYIQDRDKIESDADSAQGYNCPNCGAPITSLGHKRCEYCGCGIEEYNIKVWKFTDVVQR